METATYAILYIAGILTGLMVSVLLLILIPAKEVRKIMLKKMNKVEKASVITYLTPEEERKEKEDNKIKALFI